MSVHIDANAAAASSQTEGNHSSFSIPLWSVLQISLGSLSSAAQKDAAAAFSSGRRARPSLSRGSDSSRQSGDELLKSKGHYANATGMIAASTQAGGKGVNCLKFQSIRSGAAKTYHQHLGNLIEERRLPAADLVLCFVLEQSLMVSGLSNSEGPVHGIDARRCADTTGLIRRM